MKAVIAVIFALVLSGCAGADLSGGGTLTSTFTKSDLRTWCAQGRSDEEVKKDVGAHPLITGSFEHVNDSEDWLIDTIRFTYPIEELADGRCRHITSMELDGTSLVFRFRDHRLIEVMIRRRDPDRRFEFVWQAVEAKANQPLQPTPTSVTSAADAAAAPAAGAAEH